MSTTEKEAFAALQAAFEDAGIVNLSLYRRGERWGRKWVVTAAWEHPSGDYHKRKHIGTEPHEDLGACLRTLLRHGHEVEVTPLGSMKREAALAAASEAEKPAEVAQAAPSSEEEWEW